MSLFKREDALKTVVEENDRLRDAKNTYDNIKNPEIVKMMLTLSQRKQLSFTKLTDELSIKPKQIHNYIDRLSISGEIKIDFKRESPLQMFIGLSNFGENVLKDIFKLDNNNIETWRNYNIKHLSREIDSILL